MRAPSGAPDWLAAFTAEERPDLWTKAGDEGVFNGVWPEYNMHGNHTPQYFGTLFRQHPHLQLLFTDQRSGRIIGRGRTIPFRWDGELASLPAGIDAVGLHAVSEPGPPTALSALAAEVAPDYQGGGLSALIIKGMAEVAGRHGLAPLVAPVRPSWKDRYPIIPIDRYARWERPDGLPFDPWQRVHARLGARLLRTEPRSLEIFAPTADWEAWTGMAFPEDGEYTFPGGLAPLTVAGGTGTYWEPNIWMLHEIR
jgi:GNAT superfamily N-acetyltransferase